MSNVFYLKSLIIIPPIRLIYLHSRCHSYKLTAVIERLANHYSFSYLRQPIAFTLLQSLDSIMFSYICFFNFLIFSLLTFAEGSKRVVQPSADVIDFIIAVVLVVGGYYPIAFW